MIDEKWAACFKLLTPAQAVQVKAALQGLPEDVLARVRNEVVFTVGPMPDALGRAFKSRGSGRLVVRIGNLNSGPGTKIVLWHEIAHVVLYHVWEQYRYLYQPRVLQKTIARQEVQAWALANRWFTMAASADQASSNSHPRESLTKT